MFPSVRVLLKISMLTFMALKTLKMRLLWHRFCSVFRCQQLLTNLSRYAKINYLFKETKIKSCGQVVATSGQSYPDFPVQLLQQKRRRATIIAFATNAGVTEQSPLICHQTNGTFFLFYLVLKDFDFVFIFIFIFLLFAQAALNLRLFQCVAGHITSSSVLVYHLNDHWCVRLPDLWACWATVCLMDSHCLINGLFRLSNNCSAE